MTATAITVGLLPIMWGHGTGSEVMQRIAAPMVGGMVTVTVMSLLVLPVVYGLVLQLQSAWRERNAARHSRSAASPQQEG
jgi:Cu(I)/Ag(I) efflux system membrane protein CusA/SilA